MKYSALCILVLVLSVTVTSCGGQLDYTVWSPQLLEEAEGGDALAQHQLGMIYSFGQGVPNDEKEAMKWYRKAADQGYVMAQHSIGYAYRTGLGVLKDYVTAYAWYSLSAFNGNEKGQENRDRLAKEMTPEQIAEAQELSKELLKQIEENKKKKAK